MKRQIKEIKENKIVDIYKGNFIEVWEDGEWVYFSTPFAVINMLKEDWPEFKQDLIKLGEL